MAIVFSYKSFVCEEEHLESLLNEAGEQGWRLHTCEPFVVVGREGVGTLKFAIVMDQMFDDAPQQAPVPGKVLASEGIPMKG